MEKVFLNVLNMSITASYVILFVLFARILLRKAPKIFSYSLWSVVLFRLVCPFSFSSTLSFFSFVKPDTMEHIPANIGYMAKPQVNLGINPVDNLVNNLLPAVTPIESVNPMQMIMTSMSVIWLTGIIVLLTYSVLSYILLKREIHTAMLISDNIFECEKIKSPFILGIIIPKIYLPIGLAESERSYILMHERTHIKRFDYIIKPFAYLVLCFHWFNPLVWISFVLMSHDMEMSCDERVLNEMGRNIKKDYSNSLLSLATHKRMVNGSPLAFGENNVKSRIKNVLNYKKPTLWVLAVSIVFVSIVATALAVNPKSGKENLSSLNTNPITTIEKNISEEVKVSETEGFNRKELMASIPERNTFLYGIRNNNTDLLENIDTTKSQFEKGYYDYQGIINNNILIQMSICPLEKEIVGTYFYEKDKKELKLQGKAGEKSIILYEYDETGKNTGIFQGRMNAVDKIEGTWISADGKSLYPFTLSLKSIIMGAEYGKRYGLAVKNQSDQDVEDYVSKIQNYVVNDNKELLAEQVQYPITVKINSKATKIQNKDDFISKYDEILYPDYKKVIINAFTKYLFANYQGIMLGNGEMWINEVPITGNNSKLMIIAINN